MTNTQDKIEIGDLLVARERSDIDRRKWVKHVYVVIDSPKLGDNKTYSPNGLVDLRFLFSSPPVSSYSDNEFNCGKGNDEDKVDLTLIREDIFNKERRTGPFYFTRLIKKPVS